MVVSAVVDPGGQAMQVMVAQTSLDAPEHMVLEVVAAVRNRLLRGELTPPDAEEALRRAWRLPIDRHPLQPLAARAWELRDNLTPYDAAYAALAERLGTDLLTYDRALASIAGLRCRVQALRF